MAEFNASAEDPLSEENRNKRISVEESNQRVRKWLNANTSYFGPPEDESGANDAKKDDSKDANSVKKASMNVVNTKTEVIDQGDFISHSVPPPALVSVGLAVPARLAASVPHGATFVPGFINAGPKGGHAHQGYDGRGVATSSIGGKSESKATNGSKSSFHIENMFGPTVVSSSAASGHQHTGNMLQTTQCKDYLSFIGQMPSSQQSAVSCPVGKEQPMKMKKRKKSETRTASISSPTGNQKDSRHSPMLVARIPPLRVSPSVSQLGGIGMVHGSISTSSRKTPTRESPASRGSSMSPQASSVKTTLSNSRTEQQSPRASPQNVPKFGMGQADTLNSSISASEIASEVSRPPMSVPVPLSNVLRPGETMPRYNLQQQQHLADALRNRYIDNQRMAAYNSFRPPQMNTSSQLFRQGE